MKRSSVAFALCAFAAMSNPAWAWTHVQGSITRIDPKAHELTLDGTPYAVKPSVSLAGLAVGDTVSINAEPRSGKYSLVDKVRKIG